MSESEVKKLILDKSKEQAKRRFVISDIHGCHKTFKALLSQIALKQEDLLFIVGDAVNRGPDSKSILDEILRLKAENYQIFYLRGNHEQMILDSEEKAPKHTKRLIRNHNNGGLFRDGELKEKYRKLLEDTFHYIELEDYFLVHAGFDFDSTDPFDNPRPMMYLNKFKAKRKMLKGKRVVVGHKPKKLQKILKRIANDKRKIFIDNGCVNHHLDGQGNLLCFNLDTRAVSIQKNLDK